MCGIAGILGPNVDAGRVRAMVDAQRHRGPDGSAVEMIATAVPDVRLGLGHARLAILDLSPAGRQPMQHAESGCWVVYNGEIYNHRDVRADLGGEFRSTCDTETLLAAYARRGRRCVD